MIIIKLNGIPYILSSGKVTLWQLLAKQNCKNVTPIITGVLVNDILFQEGHLVSCMTKLFFLQITKSDHT